jgi:copper chaperone CopZ
MATVNLDIQGMHCGGCATGIQMITEGMDGVTKSFVDLDAKKGTFEYDESKVKPEQMIAEIGKLGYTATVSPA